MKGKLIFYILDESNVSHINDRIKCCMNLICFWSTIALWVEGGVSLGMESFVFDIHYWGYVQVCFHVLKGNEWPFGRGTFGWRLSAFNYTRMQADIKNKAYEHAVLENFLHRPSKFQLKRGWSYYTILISSKIFDEWWCYMDPIYPFTKWCQ